jgi:hypothetical protein
MVMSVSPLSGPEPQDEKPLSPEQARLVGKVRWLMALSGVATLLGIVVVVGVIGYRVFGSEGSVAPPDVTALLPKNARIVTTAISGQQVVVTLDLGGATEIRTFDVRSLKPTGRLRFATEP